ncbi:Polyketide cyclase / dehydrase and lipid transport [Chryseobacterium arachidis]|uniref:Polyketide cyclase / dehydrase and lipid transport n=1 Tax=Chryseobacterium arachidis TaxID=1416778 RepID=A0A1M4V9W3_9FLAO|nr:SRPBCC family protein [Chryseobacterium arachidis]SHE65769.1 Polyketide cyclase / dehydrase and lipid transport [Chryseobacterium arachidis]
MKKLVYSFILIIGIVVITLTCLEIFTSYNVSESINKKAPVKTYQEITINAPAQKVCGIMSGINYWTDWHSDVKDAKLNGPFEKGSTFDWKSGGLTIHSTLHTVQQRRKIGWTGKAFGAFAIHNWSFVEHNGKTKVKVEESMEGWLVSLMSNTFQKGLENSLQIWLRNLKVRAEKK